MADITTLRLPIKLLTPQETAAILGVTVGTLQIWRTTRRYPLNYIKSGRLIRYRAEDIQVFIDSRRISIG